jgi:hypothetical protein
MLLFTDTARQKKVTLDRGTISLKDSPQPDDFIGCSHQPVGRKLPTFSRSHIM